MPLVRFKIRNELSLGGPELNRSPAVENEEPKAILGAIEVAGLVGILRQLGDLAEFSAEVFNGIQEEVTVTASRCQKLTSRVRRIESALSPLEKAVLSQTSHIHFAYTAGCEWHPRIRNGHSHFIQSELPLCVMETYEQCRDPPPLHLLDRFDANGPGSCLRKYSDPTFFKKATSNPTKADDVKVQKDKARRKRKKKTLPQRNICRSNAVSTSDETNGAHLSSLTDDKQTTSQSTSTVDMPRSSNMQDLSDIVDQSHLQRKSDEQEESEAQVQSKPRDSITGSGYIEYVINQSPVNKPDVKLLEGFSSRFTQPADKIGSAVPEGCIEVVDDNILYSPSENLPLPCASIVCDEKKETLEPMAEKTSKDEEATEIHESRFGPGTPDMVRGNQRDFDRTCILFDEVDIVGEKQCKSQANIIDGTLGIENEGEYKSEQGSEADEFVDARNTIEAESESEHYFGDVSTYCSEDADSDNNDGSEDIPFEEMAQESCHDDSADESFSGSYSPTDASVSCFLSDPMSGKTLSHGEDFQKPSEFVAEEAFSDETILQEESVTARPLLAGDCADDKILSEEHVSAEKILPEEQWANYSFFTDAVPQEKILPKEPVAKYPPSSAEVSPSKILLEKPDNKMTPVEEPKIRHLAEALPDNKMSPAEEPDVAHPSFPETVQGKKISQKVLDSNILSVPEAVSQERISVEEFVGINPCLAEAVLTEEPDITGPSFTKAMPIEEVLPEKPLEENNSLAELPVENIVQEKSDDATHPSSAKTAPEENISALVVDSKNLSVAETVPQEQILVDEIVGIDQSLTESVASGKVVSKELLDTCPLGAFPEEKISHDATHPSEAVSDEKFSPEVFDSSNLSLEEAVPQEETSLEEFVDIDPYLAEAVPDKRFLPGELLETEEKILHEEANDTTHLSFSQAVSDEQISPEVLDSTDMSVAKAVPQEKISLVGTDQCLEEAVPDERFLPEEPVTTYLTKALASEKVLPEELLETYPSLAELPEEKISNEETDDAIDPYEAVSDENISPAVSGSSNLSLEETVQQDQISFVGTNPCLVRPVLDERFLPEEHVPSWAIEGVLPEKPLETDPSLADLPKEKILEEEADNASHPSLSEAVSDEQTSTNLPVAEAAPQEKISHEEEFVGIDPCFEEAVPDERLLSVTTCPSLKKAVAIEEVMPEKSLETYPSMPELAEEKILHERADDATHPSLTEAVNDDQISLQVLEITILTVAEAVRKEQISFDEVVGINPGLAEEKILCEEADVATHPSISEAVSDEQISPEVLNSTNLPVTESVTQDQISLVEEFVDIDPCLPEAVPDKRVFREEPITTSLSLTKAVPFEEVLPELENLPKEKILVEESDDDDATHPSCAKAVSDENISPENLASTNLSVAKAIPQEEISLEEESVGINPCLEEAATNERVSQEESVTVKPIGKILQEEERNDVTHPSLEEKISQEEKAVEEPDAAWQPSSEAHGPHNKTFPEEKPVPNDSILPKEAPTTSYLALAESIPDQQVFLDDAAFLSFAEAIFDQKFSPEPSSVTDLPGAESDVSMNQESVESVSLWSNGGLFGLAPSKPPVFAAPNSVSEHEIKKDESVKDTEKKNSLPLGASSPTSQQQQQQSNNNVLSHSNGSFRVFGLSHRLLMAGFRGNSSSTTACKFEALPPTSYNTEEDNTTTKQTQLDYESSSLFGSPTSSPPVQHMEISFDNAKDVSSVSKLRLRIPSQYNGQNADMFQLVPEGSDEDDDDDEESDDIFCQSSSSPCVSDSELLWESDESPREKEEVGETSMGSLSGSFLDLPCFDSIDHHPSSSSRPDQEVTVCIPSVSEIIRDWPPIQPKKQSL